MSALVMLANPRHGRGILCTQPAFQGANQQCDPVFVPWLACPSCRQVQAFSCLLKCQRTTYSPANKTPIIKYAMTPLYIVQIAGDAHNAVMRAKAPLKAKNTNQTCVTRRV